MQKKNQQLPDVHEAVHPKQDFQVERIAFFSDAVFAIALTLLIIEFKVPHVSKESTYEEVWHEIAEMKFKFAALIISFALIVNYWSRHHLLFKHVHNYNKKIIRANMLVLLPIIFFPFTTSFLYESITAKEEIVRIPMLFFMINNIVAGATMYFFYWTVMKRYKEMSYKMTVEDAAEFDAKLLWMNGSFLLVVILMCLPFVPFGYSFLGMLPMVFLRSYTRIYKRKNTTKTEYAK